MSEGSEHGIYAFDQFKLDVEKLMLYRDGVDVALPPKVVKTLVVMVENRGAILSKEELIERVWSDSIVEESNLSQHLYLLRKTLGTRPNGQPYIETLRRRGYRFNSDVQLLTNGKGPAPQRSERGVRIPGPDVEREGNVLRVVDWRPVADSAALPTPTDDPATVSAPVVATAADRPRRWSLSLAMLFAAALCVIAVIVILTVIFLRPDSQGETAAVARNEMSVTRLTNGNFPNDATISPDGATFVYHESDGESSRIWLQQAGHSGRVEIASSTNLMYGAKTFSKDGRFVYYAATDKRTGNSELYRVPSIGGASSKLLQGIAGPVSFSPDGSEIVFLRQNSEKGSSSLIVADKDGRAERVIRTAESPKILGVPSWSRDASLIAFSESDVTGSTTAATVSILGIDPVDGSMRELSGERWDTAYRIEWMTRGDGFVMIATRENEGRSTRRDQVYFVSFPSGESRRLTSSGMRHQPFSLGVSADDAVLATPFSRSSQIWSIDLSSDKPSEPVQISAGSADGRAGLAPLPDGRVGYITRVGELLSIWVMNADGSDARQLTNDPPALEELRADPQGRYFVYVTQVGKQSHLFRIDLDGGNRRQLTFGDGNDGDSTISPDGNWVVYSSVFLRDRLRTELWKVSIDGGDAVRFSDVECASPHFSPTGSMVTCVRDEKEIFVLSAATGDKLESYTLPSGSIANYGVGWTPDETALTFMRLSKGYSNAWIIPRDANPNPRELTHFSSGYLTRFAYSADGSRLYVARGYPIDDVILISNYR